MIASEIRARARSLLKGKTPLAVVASLVLGGCLTLTFFLPDAGLYLFGAVDFETGELITPSGENTVALAAFYVLLWLLSLLFFEPLKIGATRFFFALADGAYPSAATIFYAFSREHYGRALAVGLRVKLRRTGWYLLFLLPSLLSGAYALTVTDEATASLLSAGTTLLFTAGLTAALVINLRYFLVSYVFAASDRVLPAEAVKIGVRMMKGGKCDLFILKMTFLGWWLLTVPTVGISLIYTVPYYLTSLGVFAKDRIDFCLPREE